ncbi:MAG: hypothetical protein Q9219_006054, partial [cf. Caloplaca sp. 3 TL-2023]
FLMGGLCAVLPFGRLYAVFDTKILYCLSIVLFLAGSALCGGAPTMSAMIVGRVLAGVGGNGMYIGVVTLLSVKTTDTERPTYLGLIGLVYGIGTVVGPIIGGAFAGSAATWRWGFYLNLVVGGIFAPIYIFVLPSHRPSSSVNGLKQLQSFDYVGAVLQAGSMSAVTMALNFGVTYMLAAQLLGLVLSLSISGAVFINRSLDQLQALFPDLQRTQLQNAITGVSGEFFTELPRQLQEKCLEVIMSSLQTVFILVYVAGAVSLVAAIFLSNKKLKLDRVDG